jgi:hypothetical protein
MAPTPITITARDAFRPHLRAARAWLIAGALIVLFVPAARTAGGTFGWLPFWLLIAPILVLMQIEVLAGFARVRHLRRRLDMMRRSSRAQARRHRGGRRVAQVA